MKKYFIYLLLVLFIGIIVGCDKNEDSYNFEFNLKNNTDKDIIITSYRSWQGNEIQRILTLESGKTINETILNNDPSDDYSFDDFLKGDSIVISYNIGERKEIFSCIGGTPDSNCSEPRNILSPSNILRNRNGKIIIQSYSIEQEDYDNAND
jgi:hypothetical protein